MHRVFGLPRCFSSALVFVLITASVLGADDRKRFSTPPTLAAEANSDCTVLKLLPSLLEASDVLCPAIGDAPEILQAISDWVLRSAF